MGGWLRLLVVSECPNLPSSMGKVNYVLAKYLGREFKVFFACPAGQPGILSRGYAFNPCRECGDPLLKEWERGLCRRVCFDREVFVYPLLTSAFRRLLRDVDPDVILVYGTPYSQPFSDILKMVYGLRREGALDAVVVGYFISESLYLPQAYSVHALNVDFIACPTEFTLRTFIDSFNHFRSGLGDAVVSSGRCAVVPHGVDLSLYSPSSLRGASRLVDGGFVYGTFAKNHIRKNVGALVRAYSSLPDDVRLGSKLFIPLIKYAGGPVWDVDAVADAAGLESGNRVDGRVVCLPQDLEELGVHEWFLLSIYKSIDAFIFPSIGESFGLPPLEAAACGRPVVVTDHPALREVWGGSLPEEAFIRCRPFITGEGLILCDPLVESLREVMVRLFRDEGFRESVREASMENARRFPDSVLGEGMLKAIKEALDLGACLLSEVVRS